MRRSLRVRDKIILVTSMCIFIFASIGGYYFIKRESRLYTEDIIHQGKTIAGISSVIFTNALVYKELELVEEIAMTDYLDYYILDVMNRDPRISYIVILDTSGRVLSHSDIKEYGKIYTDPVTSRALTASETLTQTFVDKDNNEILDVAAPMRISTKYWGVCRVGMSLAGLKQQITELRNRIGSMVSIFLLLSLLVISIIGKKLTNPLVKLSQAMDRITETGDLDVEQFSPKPRKDEIGMLQNSFSWMLKRLRKASEERLKLMDLSLRAEKMASIGLLASGVAHEINNPLGGIILCFKNLTETKMEDDARKQHIEVIQSGLHKIQYTVKDLLNFARSSPMKKETASINELLEESLKLADYLMGKRNIRIVRRLKPNLPQIHVDPSRVCQVFLNIIINAVQAMGDNGVLTLTSDISKDFCWVKVSDTGPGIDPRLKGKIFDTFFTTKGQSSGTGLGLAVSRIFINQHGGTIEVVSEKKDGAAFIIKLPLAGRE
jgi:two-component system NtrC family sensor kinase